MGNWNGGRREIEGELKKEGGKGEINRELKRKMDWNHENESKKQRIWERKKSRNTGILVKNERMTRKKKQKAEKKGIEKEEYNVN